jgi:hypothetical protein
MIMLNVIIFAAFPNTQQPRESFGIGTQSLDRGMVDDHFGGRRYCID